MEKIMSNTHIKHIILLPNVKIRNDKIKTETGWKNISKINSKDMQRICSGRKC